MIDNEMNMLKKGKWNDRQVLPNRKQINLLGKWVGFRKQLIENSSEEESEKSSKLTILYFIALLELSRQDSIICIERGRVLTSIWSNYFLLQQKILFQTQDEFDDAKAQYRDMLTCIECSKDEIIRIRDCKIEEV